VYWAPAPVAVKDHPRGGIAGGDGVGQRIGDQLGAQVISQGVADDAARGDVDHADRYSHPSQVAM
jgi:hypothetical protein